MGHHGPSSFLDSSILINARGPQMDRCMVWSAVLEYFRFTHGLMSLNLFDFVGPLAPP